MTDHEHELPEGVGEQFIDHMQNPRNIGVLEAPRFEAEMTGVCGDSIGVTIAVNGQRIRSIRVAPRGCAYTVVCASAMSELAEGKTLDEALGLEPEAVAEALGGLPEDHLHCARLAVNTLGEAIAEYYRTNREKQGTEAGHADF